MSAVSISQFDLRLVNQQRQINDHVFRLCDSSKYLTTLSSNISPCQKVTTLILKSLYNSSFRRWKKCKNILSTTVFLSWIPFKICASDKFLSTTPVTQFLLKAITWQNIKLCRNGKFHVERDACRRKIDGKIVAFLSSVVYYFKDLLKSGKRALRQKKSLVYNLMVYHHHCPF